MNDTKVTNTVATLRAMGDSTADICRAREIARAYADSLSPVPAAEVMDTLVLVVSELVTNAVRHGGGRYTLELCADEAAVIVAVSDTNPAHPREVTPDLNGGSGGFGWHMVRRLSDEVTVSPGPIPGKTIIALIGRTAGHSED
ncbi:ATP-binding protein [Streptomyces albidochromogenes]|uniref:ATP-binding protein n=1 Tax=Streptomyces albidochromogenes TaxID=329524 RepID=UPI00110FBF6D|nr:ATP-binding protein [Streptomyces albidochromogenes]